MQGKEKESTFGLNRINLGARTYNPTIGRMDGIDALSLIMPSFSPYNANFNNPLRFLDPDGNEAKDSQDFTYTDGYGTYSARNSSGSVSFSGNYQNSENSNMGGDPPKKKEVQMSPKQIQSFVKQTSNLVSEIDEKKDYPEIAKTILINGKNSLTINKNILLNSYGATRGIFYLSKTSNFLKPLGKLSTPALGLTLVSNGIDYHNGEIGAGRAIYKNSISIAAWATPALLTGLGASTGLGAIAGITVGSIGYVGETMYDKVWTPWANQMAKFTTDFNNAVSNGWIPH